MSMSKTNPNDPVHTDYPHDDVPKFSLTKREYMATAIMQGILASGAGGEKQLKVLAAVDYADALISALNMEKV